MCPPGQEYVSVDTRVRECCPPHSIPCVSPPQHHHPERMGAPAALRQPPHPLPVPPTQLPAASFLFVHSLKLKKTKIKRKKYYLLFLQVNPLIIFTFIYSCCFIKKLPLYFFKKPLLSFFFFFFVSMCVSLFTVSACFLHCHR